MNTFWQQQIEMAGLGAIAQKVERGQRLSPEDGLQLYLSSNLNAVGALANIVRERLNGNTAYWVRNQHVNYTNVCNKGCLFCSFYAKPKDDPRAYVMTPQQAAQKVRNYGDVPISEVHVVGGVNPKLPYEYYLELLREIKAARPEAHIKAFTMVEIDQIVRIAKKAGKNTAREVFEDLKAAGLDALPGGGAEVMSDRVHEDLFATKPDSARWLELAREAHLSGLKSNATLLYGHVEQTAEKIEHFVKLRELQDETGGFLSFIPLSWHPEKTALEDLKAPTGVEDLREIAVARLMLDNFPHIKSFWIMNSAPVTQSALWFGADDVDGTIMEYEIIRDPSKDRKQVLTSRQLVEMIVEAGREPVERDPLYNVLSRGLEGVSDVETLLSSQNADLIQPSANLGITQREGVTTASQKMKEKGRELILSNSQPR
ncbi:de-hypoxanthine futalosine cyclase [Abditibacterium utsteinense]|uniref:De-hypoxanthine futalosine cyclase n=1 Tax=Abditibacterium utsteinense TaxID=1960156 RepID=A0A2S8SWN0_9BACT|nr:CofH family radical SAM protein [Abditibacterium utsteinense]PQV65216.1 de-hypoxanthine futalosine cyclase [Abditibacterium utsteinense]